MITIKSRGSFNKTIKYLKQISSNDIVKILESYGREGVAALASATPIDSGETATSWNYEIVQNERSISLQFYNTNMNDGECVAILIQYGHGTGTGGYVVGRDYINPAIQPIFDKISNAVLKEVTA